MMACGMELTVVPKALKVLYKVRLPIFFLPNSQEGFHRGESPSGKELTKKCYNNKIF
jgi:hypothetical protein